MCPAATRLYRAREFAALAGVTVRTLHYYDRLGLLKPGRTNAGYRLYRERDLERLEHIVALKFLGIPLKQIQTLLERNAPDLRAALRIQRRVLEERRRQVDNAIGAIRDAELLWEQGRYPDSAVLKKIIEVIEMQNNPEWMMKYYNEEARARMEPRSKVWSPEMQERVSREWSDLFRDVEAALGEDPGGERAHALAERWMTLVEGFTGGDPPHHRGAEGVVCRSRQLAL